MSAHSSEPAAGKTDLFPPPPAVSARAYGKELQG